MAKGLFRPPNAWQCHHCCCISSFLYWSMPSIGWSNSTNIRHIPENLLKPWPFFDSYRWWWLFFVCAPWQTQFSTHDSGLTSKAWNRSSGCPWIGATLLTSPKHHLIRAFKGKDHTELETQQPWCILGYWNMCMASGGTQFGLRWCCWMYVFLHVVSSIFARERCLTCAATCGLSIIQLANLYVILFVCT